MENEPLPTGQQDPSPPEIPWWESEWYLEWERLAKEGRKNGA
jgi:hypothetical protein